MSLRDLIFDSKEVATATPATPATHNSESECFEAKGDSSVATVATVAVATPESAKTDASKREVPEVEDTSLEETFVESQNQLVTARPPGLPALDPAAEARRQEVISMLAGDPRITYAITSDTEAEPDSVIVALALRGKATCELRIPKGKYDGLALLQLIEHRTVRDH